MKIHRIDAIAVGELSNGKESAKGAPQELKIALKLCAGVLQASKAKLRGVDVGLDLLSRVAGNPL